MLQQIQDKLKVCSAKLQVAEETIKRLVNEKRVLQEKLVRLERKKTEEVKLHFL